MAASLRSPLPVPAAFRRRRAAAVVRASSPSPAVSSAPKARFVARRSESTSVQQLARPLDTPPPPASPYFRSRRDRPLEMFACLLVPAAEYMGLPASQYSVLDAERVDDSTFRCYVYRFRFFALEVCPVLLVRVDEEPNGCCIYLLSCRVPVHWRGHPLWRRRMTNSQETIDMISCGMQLPW